MSTPLSMLAKRALLDGLERRVVDVECTPDTYRALVTRWLDIKACIDILGDGDKGYLFAVSVHFYEKLLAGDRRLAEVLVAHYAEVMRLEGVEDDLHARILQLMRHDLGKREDLDACHILA